jgi:peptidoglycan-N-acetylglucosamine deacetylase
MVKLSFSWDDGADEDLKMMDLSLKHDIPSIFFIPAANPERKTMTANDIKTLALNGLEIGAHTYSHLYLTLLPFEKAHEEIRSGKYFLEQVLGRKVDHFCFPGGKYNLKLTEVSKQYFLSARTADTGAVLKGKSFLIRPSFHFYDRGRASLIYNSFINNSPFFKLSLMNIRYPDYFELVKKLIADLDNLPGIYRVIIWGHSWEIEKFQLWSRLEDLFHYLKEMFPASITAYSDLMSDTAD